MTPTEFYALVARMRDQQTIYFKTRSGRALAASKTLEKLVDKAIEAHQKQLARSKATEQSLFPDDRVLGGSTVKPTAPIIPPITPPFHPNTDTL